MVACLGNNCQIQMAFYPASISYFASTAIRDVPLLYSSVNQGTVIAFSIRHHRNVTFMQLLSHR